MKVAEKILIGTAWTVLFLILCTPFFVSHDFLFPYVVPRTFYFETLNVLFALVVGGLFFMKKTELPGLNTGLVGALIFCAAALVLTTLTGLDPVKSFAGSFERSLGTVDLLNLLLFAGTLGVFLNGNSKRIARVLVCSFLIAIGVAIVKLVLGINLSGNLTFTAVYLLFHLFCGIHLYQEVRDRLLRYLLFAGTLFLCVTILSTGMRGAVVGLIAGLLYFTIKMVPQLSVKKRLIVVSACILLGGLYGALFFNRNTIQDIGPLQKLTEIGLNDSTIQSRLAMWQMVFEGFKENPLLGWGRGNFSAVFNKYFNSRFEHSGVGELWEDSPHNVFLEFLVDGGLLYLTAYLMLLYILFRVLPVSLKALLVAYVIESCFGIQTLHSLIPLMILVAFGLSLGEKQRVKETPTPLSVLALTGVSAFIIVSLSFNASRLSGATSLAQAARSNDPVETEKYLRQAELRLKHYPYLQAEGASILTGIFSKKDPAFDELRLENARKLEAAFSKYPFEGKFGLLAHGSYLRQANNDSLQRASNLLKQLQKLSPGRTLFQELSTTSL